MNHLIVTFSVIFLFLVVDQDHFKWFYYSWLPWSLDTNHQVTVNDACRGSRIKLRKGRPTCPRGKLLWELFLLCVYQISQEWSQEKRGLSASPAFLFLLLLFFFWRSQVTKKKNKKTTTTTTTTALTATKDLLLLTKRVITEKIIFYWHALMKSTVWSLVKPRG